MYEATFRIDHTSPYADASMGDDVHVEMWCNQYCDLVYLRGADIDVPIETFRDTIGIRDIVHKDDEAVLITDTCLLDFRDDLLEGYLQPHHCLSLPPLTYRDGSLLARVLALTEEQLSSVSHDISADHRVTVEATRGISAVVSVAERTKLSRASWTTCSYETTYPTTRKVVLCPERESDVPTVTDGD